MSETHSLSSGNSQIGNQFHKRFATPYFLFVQWSITSSSQSLALALVSRWLITCETFVKKKDVSTNMYPQLNVRCIFRLITMIYWWNALNPCHKLCSTLCVSVIPLVGFTEGQPGQEESRVVVMQYLIKHSPIIFLQKQPPNGKTQRNNFTVTILLRQRSRIMRK